MKMFNILLVDDNQQFLDAFEFMLEEVMGNQIEKIYRVANGQQCVNFLEAMPIDIIFMDIDMPVMNGIEATRKIVARYRFIHIVAVSFHNDMQSVREMIEAGARNYLIKEDINRDNLQRIFKSIKV
jgi:CheY-like chemotaxis protein